jgi:hypothetical protein
MNFEKQVRVRPTAMARLVRAQARYLHNQRDQKQESAYAYNSDAPHTNG